MIESHRNCQSPSDKREGHATAAGSCDLGGTLFKIPCLKEGGVSDKRNLSQKQRIKHSAQKKGSGGERSNRK